MRYFYDTEFLEDGRTIELISIGIVAEDGRELYLVNRDAPWRRIKRHGWLMANVVPKLPQPHGDWILHMPTRWPIDFHSPAVCKRQEIADRVAAFLTGDVELWADYCAYDHVVLCQLFGPMVNLPAAVPMFTNDFQQALRSSGTPAMPAQPSGLHNALDDARHLRSCFEALNRDATA